MKRMKRNETHKMKINKKGLNFNVNDILFGVMLAFAQSLHNGMDEATQRGRE